MITSVAGMVRETRICVWQTFNNYFLPQDSPNMLSQVLNSSSQSSMVEGISIGTVLALVFQKITYEKF